MLNHALLCCVFVDDIDDSLFRRWLTHSGIIHDILSRWRGCVCCATSFWRVNWQTLRHKWAARRCLRLASKFTCTQATTMRGRKLYQFQVLSLASLHRDVRSLIYYFMGFNVFCVERLSFHFLLHIQLETMENSQRHRLSLAHYKFKPTNESEDGDKFNSCHRVFGLCIYTFSCWRQTFIF